ncbi:hypothetical protein NDU88_004126 [Pleurodeles waltl]|uniref:Uncharacterized protein n=1 Tax=Pleurodeles waltl TaxID=8319 RepID=A0AAV7SHW1_PLEWA|nr:hypothetical protein NDU88_004126 [Pleurodeles waltl]
MQDAVPRLLLELARQTLARLWGSNVRATGSRKLEPLILIGTEFDGAAQEGTTTLDSEASDSAQPLLVADKPSQDVLFVPVSATTYTTISTLTRVHQEK